MRNATTPGALIFVAVLLGIVGCGLAYASTSDEPVFMIVAWPVLGISGVLGFTGLTAWAVEIGVRSARR